MARKNSKSQPAPATAKLVAFRHGDPRANIPTEELRDFVAADESKPPQMLYPRDPSLDPQLVWKGKDEQDREPLAVDVVPIYSRTSSSPTANQRDGLFLRQVGAAGHRENFFWPP